MTIIATSYLSLCKLNFISAIILEVKRTTKVNIKLAVIIELLDFKQKESFDDHKSMYKTKNIYNIKAEICHKNLTILSPIQVLI